MKKIMMQLWVLLALAGGMILSAQAQDFFSASDASNQPSAAVTPSQASISAQTQKSYQQWQTQYQQLQNKALQQQVIDPATYGLPMPHQTGSRSALQGAR